jgi:hypothetical protein
LGPSASSSILICVIGPLLQIIPSPLLAVSNLAPYSVTSCPLLCLT